MSFYIPTVPISMWSFVILITNLNETGADEHMDLIILQTHNWPILG